MITPDVSALRDQFHLPGTRVLQFAFDGHSDNPYLPHNYVPNTVVYTGTHDNNTTRGWFEELPDSQRQNLWRYLKRPAGNGVMAAPRAHGPGVVVGGCARHGSVTGSAQPGQRGPDERARSCRRQLALALHGGHAVRVRLPVAAGPDGIVKSVECSSRPTGGPVTDEWRFSSSLPCTPEATP